VSHDPSRKSFLGKLIGLFAVASLAPRVLAKTAVNAATEDSKKAPAPFSLRPDSRAVSRRADSV